MICTIGWATNCGTFVRLLKFAVLKVLSVVDIDVFETKLLLQGIQSQSIKDAVLVLVLNLVLMDRISSLVLKRDPI